MADKNEKRIRRVQNKTHLKMEAFDSQMGQTLENLLKTRYPEAEIDAKVDANKSFSVFSLKKTGFDRLTISYYGDVSHNVSYFTFNYLSPNGCLFQLFGIWSVILQQIVAKSFKNEVIEEVGRDLGARYRAKTEYINKTMNPVLYFVVGTILMVMLLIALWEFLINGISIRYGYITFSVKNIIELLSYVLVFWISFFIFVRKYTKLLKAIPYIVLILSTIFGLTIIANMQLSAYEGHSTLLIQIVGRLSAWLIMVISIYALWKRERNRNHEKRKVLYLP